MKFGLISIVIPCFNQEKYLPEAIDSVMRQTFTQWECIIVNDGSTDESLSIIKRYAELDTRFKYESIPNSSCANIPRLKAVELAKGEWILNLDADDMLSENSIECMYETALKNEADIVIQKRKVYNETMKIFNKELSDSIDWTGQLLTGKEAFINTIGGLTFSTSGMLAKKTLYDYAENVGGVFTDEYNARMILYHASKIAFASSYYLCRIIYSSISHKPSINLYESSIHTDEKLEIFINSNFNDNSQLARIMRKSRIINTINMFQDFIKNKSIFNNEESKRILENFKKAHSTLDRRNYRNELPYHWYYSFVYSFSAFRIFSIIHPYIKFNKSR